MKANRVRKVVSDRRWQNNWISHPRPTRSLSRSEINKRSHDILRLIKGKFKDYSAVFQTNFSRRGNSEFKFVHDFTR